MAAYDTIVVGLGAAGATAAGTLARGGRRVLALEAAARAGGRVRTERCGDGVVELGAEWIQGTHPSRVYDLAVQNNISVGTQNLDYDVFRSDGTQKDLELIDELMKFYYDVVAQKSDKNESVGAFVTKKFKKYLAEKHPDLFRDEEFVENFLEYMNIIENNTVASHDWDDITAKGDFECIDGDQFASWHRHGYKTFFEILLNTYNNGPGLPTLDIKFNTEVTSISWPRVGTGDVVVTCRGGEQYTAPNVIVTVSLGVLKDRHTTLFSPPLPEEKIEAINMISMGLLDKIVLSFDKPWWSRNMAFYWTVEDKKKLPEEDKWLGKIVQASTPLGSNNTITLWTYGEVAKLVETLPEEVVKTKVVELLQRFMGANVTVPQPTGMLRSTWYSNPYTRGSVSYNNLQMPQHPHIRETLGSPLLDAAGTPRVLFAGEATERTRYGTVHGASDTGYRAADMLLKSSNI
ncbi:peroxisomal N(1)-acetyl-spermine/spermidine oxidase-like [Epargyreus clarus]|uniref:peroxisomal N(1)-acetyl-spermine/spermidine oxidase-like n=1 Tax=Epargyreus clarus TaxID=520877 RepID=UPI003C2D5FF2